MKDKIRHMNDIIVNIFFKFSINFDLTSAGIEKIHNCIVLFIID